MNPSIFIANQQTSSANRSWPFFRATATGGWLLIAISCFSLGCFAQQQSAPAATSSSPPPGLTPKRIFPKEALSLPQSNVQALSEAQPVQRRALGTATEPAAAPTSTPAAAPIRRMADTPDQPRITNDESYTLTENDRIRIMVFQEPDLMTEARIGKDGTVSLPLIGSIRLAGRTVRDATRHITQLLDDGYLVKPQVTLALLEYSKRQFTILGEVQKPGTYVMPDDQPLTLQQAVGFAGGFRPSAKRGKVTVTRLVGGETIIYRVDATAFARDRNAKPFMVLPDDTIFVDETFF